VGKITYLSSLADGDTQTRLARAEVANPSHTFIPELFVEAKVILDERHVPVAIKTEALQRFRDWNVVFKKVGQIFEIAILELGERDGDWIEIKEGLSPGTEYVTENSFVVKADVMKSGAAHDH
jgi:cobalt-zinc-cadmium efflux system membrane fusion protein